MRLMSSCRRSADVHPGKPSSWPLERLARWCEPSKTITGRVASSDPFQTYFSIFFSQHKTEHYFLFHDAILNPRELFFWLWHQNNKQLGHCQRAGSKGPTAGWHGADDRLTARFLPQSSYWMRQPWADVFRKPSSPALYHVPENLLRRELYRKDLLLGKMSMSPWLGLVPTYFPQSYPRKQDSAFSCIIQIRPF